MATLGEVLKELAAARKEIAALNLKVKSLDKRVTNNEGGITTVRKNASDALARAKDATSRANSAYSLTSGHTKDITSLRSKVSVLERGMPTAGQLDDLKKIIGIFSSPAVSSEKIKNASWLVKRENFNLLKFVANTLGSEGKLSSKVKNIVSVSFVKGRATGSFVPITDWNKEFLPLRRKVDNTIIPDIRNLGTRFDGLNTKFDGLGTKFNGLKTDFGGLKGRTTCIKGKFTTVTARTRDIRKNFREIWDEMNAGLKNLNKMITAMRSGSAKTRLDNASKDLGHFRDKFRNIRNIISNRTRATKGQGIEGKFMNLEDIFTDIGKC